MALRFCKGKFVEFFRDELSPKCIAECFDNNETMIVVNHQSKVYGYINRALYNENNSIEESILKEYIDLDERIFDKARAKILLIDKLGYIPVIYKNKVLCFAFSDEILESVRNKIIDLKLFCNSKELKKEYCKYNGVIIYGVNEVTYELSNYLSKQGIPYKIIGDSFLISKTNFDNSHSVISKPLNIFVEGNAGLSLDELPFWRTELEWHERDFSKIYKLYDKKNSFKDISSDENYDSKIRKDIGDKKPFMLGRLGNTELQILKEYVEKKNGLRNGYTKFWLDYFYTTSGFFSKDNNRVDEDIDKYVEISLNAIKNCDYHAYWGGKELAEGLGLLLKKFKNRKSVDMLWDDMIAPNIGKKENCWISDLENKKVLVISPYSETIKKQYKIKENLYCELQTLPDFELITYQSLETQLGNNCGFTNWFEAYNHLKENIKQIDFDIALICCGAYGYPLASDIKNMGKQSIELCSYLPNWFGIKIKRYATCYNVNKYWNSSWTYPLETPPKDSNKIENNCYWE